VRLDDVGIARLVTHLLMLVAREGMRTGGDHGYATRYRLLVCAAAQLAGLGHRISHGEFRT
jgi:hypothetical protein